MMHACEDIDATLVARLVAAQFPQWAGLPIEPIRSAGTDNALYRLGEDMVVRLPRILTATGQIERERKWLPRLAPRLPLAVPIPIANGMPAEGYAWHWSIYRWLEGPRPSTASPIRSKPRPSWVSSSPHCSGLIPQVGRPLMSTTLSEVYLCHAGIPPPETRSGGCATHSMPPRSSLHGKRPSMRRCGRVGTYGYTVTSMQRTCWRDTGD